MNFNYKVLLFPEDLQYSEDGEYIAQNSWHNFHIFHFISFQIFCQTLIIYSTNVS